MKSCLSNKNGEHIEKLETYYFFHISKPPQDSVVTKLVNNENCTKFNHIHLFSVGHRVWQATAIIDR